MSKSITQPSNILKLGGQSVSVRFASSPKFYDVARFAIPDKQVTDQSTFDVDVVVGHADPSPSITSPDLIVNGSAVSTTPTQLQYPGTSQDSTIVYRASVSLNLGENTIELVRNAEDTQSITITRKSSLTTVTVGNDSELVSALEGLYSGNGLNTDIIEVDYDVADIVAATSGISADWSGTTRSTFCTLKPAAGRSIGWDRDGIVTNPVTKWDPGLNYIKFEGIDIGSLSSTESNNGLDNANGTYFWFHNCTIQAKWSFATYGYVNGDPTAVTPPASDEISTQLYNPESEGLTKTVYFTGNTIQQCSSVSGNAALMRDNTWIDHRHDVIRFSVVALNNRVQSIKPIALAGQSDYTHCDIFQRWGSPTTESNRPHSNLYYAGMLVEGLDSHYQGWLIDSTFPPGDPEVAEASELSDAIYRDCDYESEVINPGVFFGLSGDLTRVLFDSITYPAGYLWLRYDTGSGIYDSVNISNSEFLDVRFNYLSDPDQTYDVSNTASRLDISNELNAESVGSLTYPTFSSIAVGPGRLSEYNSDTEVRYTTSVFDSSSGIEGLTELRFQDAGSFSSLFFLFDTEANKNSFVSSSPALTLIVNVTELDHPNYGDQYTYSMEAGNVNTHSATSAKIQSSNMTGSDWIADDEDLFGVSATYSLTLQ